MKAKPAALGKKSTVLESFLKEEAARNARLEFLGRVQRALGSAGRLLGTQQHRFEFERVYGPPPPITAGFMEQWITEEWIPVLHALEDIRPLIGQSARVVVERPLEPHIHAQVRRGVDVIHDILGKLNLSKPTREDVRSVAGDLVAFLGTHTSAAFYFDRMIDWAIHLLCKLAEEVERRANTLQADELKTLARSIWVAPAKPLAASRPQRGRPMVGDPAVDESLRIRKDEGATYEDLAASQAMPEEQVRGAVARARTRKIRERTVNKTPSSVNKRKSIPVQH